MNEKIMNEMNIIKDLFVSGNKVTIYGTKEEPLFLAVEIAKVIDYSNGNTHRMLDNVDEDEKLIVTLVRSGQRREMWFLTESGLYEVLMQSRKPIAKAFKSSVKQILKELRTEHEQITGEPFYEVSSLYEQWKGWSDLREDMGRDVIPFEDFLQNHPEADVAYEIRNYKAMVNNK